jgi:hypothetical protein
MARRKKPRPLTTRDRVYLFMRLHRQLKANGYTSQPQPISFEVKVGGPNQGIRVKGVDQQAFESYLTRFRQLINPGDDVHLGRMLRLLPPHLASDELRQRLAKIHAEWKFAQGITSPVAPFVLGPFAPGYQTARLYLYGSGILHSDPLLVAIWDRLPEHKRQLVTWEFHQYEGRVRRVIRDLRLILVEAAENRLWLDEPADLSA